MDKEFTVLSLEEFKKRLKAASKNFPNSSSKGLKGVETPECAADLITPLASCAHHDNDQCQEDAHSEFLRNCRALNVKPNTLLLKNVETIRSDEVVKLTENYVGSIGLQALVPLIAKNTKLKMLHLPNNGINNNAVVFLCRSLKAHPSLEWMDLSGNHDLSLPGGLALLSLVRQCSSLTHIELSNTQVPEEVVGKITKACSLNQQQLQRREPSSRIPAQALPDAVAVDPLKQGLPGRPAIAAPLQLAAEAKAGGSVAALTVWAQKEGQLLSQLATRLQELHASENRAYASLLPAADPATGWRMFEVAILAPPRLFYSELEQLLRVVFPRLNNELHASKVLLLPLVVGCGGAPECETACDAVKPDFRYSRFTPACDILADVRRSRFVTIELIGDRQGDYEQTSTGHQANPKLAAKPPHESTPPLRPVLYTAHNVAVESSRYLILAVRKDTKFMGIPPALAPLLSAEPKIENPDTYHSLVKKVLPSFSGSRPFEFIYDRAVEERAWLDHLSFRANAVSTLPVPELLISQYHCTFKQISESGNVCLGDLDDFTESVYQRLRLLIFSFLPPTSDPEIDLEGKTQCLINSSEQGCWDQYLLTDALRRRDEARLVLDMITTCNTVKKALSDQLNLYLVSPISRNSFAICSNNNAMLTAILASTAATAAKRSHGCNRSVSSIIYPNHMFTGVAFHTTRTTLFQDEPTDMHAVMCHILSQLTTNPEVLQYLALEVDTERLRAFFIRFLSGRSATESRVRIKNLIKSKMNDIEEDHAIPSVDTTTLAILESGTQDALNKNSVSSCNSQTKNLLQQEHIFAVILDGIDDIDAPVKPCDALFASQEMNTVKASEVSSERKKKPIPLVREESAKIAPEDLLPRCLARNVRVLVSCGVAPGNDNGKSFAEKLQSWDRDSMEVLQVSLNATHDAERLLCPAALAELGISLTDDEVDMACHKHDAQQSPEYLNYLIDALCINTEEGGSLSQTQLLKQLPNTIEEMARYVYDRLVNNFGHSLIYRVLGLLRVARWGIPELHLRALTKLSPQRFRQMLRYMRVATELPRMFYLKYLESHNEIPNGFVRLASPAFKSFLSQLETQRCEAHVSHKRPNLYVKPVKALDSEQMDRRVWHNHLANYYLSIVQKSIDVATFLSLLSVDNEAATSSISPHERYAVKELPFHLVQTGMWDLFNSTVLSVPYLVLVYRHKLAYPYLRDLTSAFNLRYEQLASSEDDFAGDMSSTQQPSACATVESFPVTSLNDPQNLTNSVTMSFVRLREYIHFVRENSRQLLRHPDMVLQTCVSKRWYASGCVWMDAQAFILQVKQQHHQQRWRALQQEGLEVSKAAGAVPRPPPLASRVYFRVLNAKKGAPLHLGPITCLRFTLNHAFLITGSADRTLCWLRATPSSAGSSPSPSPSPSSVSCGGALLFRVRHPTAAVEALVGPSRNGAYVTALMADRAVQVYDARAGTLVSGSTGRETERGVHGGGAGGGAAPVAALRCSARGRYYFVASEDLSLRVYAAEGSGLVAELSWRELLACRAAQRTEAGKATEASVYARRSYIHVLPHPNLDEVFACIVNEKLLVWRVADSKDACKPVSGEFFDLAGQVRQAEWLPIQAPRGSATPSNTTSAHNHQHQTEEAMPPEEEVSSYPYILLSYMECGRNIELCDLSRHRVARSFALPSKTMFARYFVCSDDQASVALATSTGEVLIYPLQGDLTPCSSSVLCLSNEGNDNRGELFVGEVLPYFTLKVFANPSSTQEALWGLSFYQGSSALLTLANGIELKYWALPVIDDDEAGPADHQDDDAKQKRVTRFISEPHGKILLHRPATCWCTASGRVLERDTDILNSTAMDDDTKCSIAIGDGKGYVTLLSIWKP